MQSEITERAKTAWNSIADEFNQWDALGLDEQETYVALTAALSDKQAGEVSCIACEGRPSAGNNPCAVCGRSALVDVPAVEPVGDDLIGYVLRYGGMCRDCADMDGVCQSGQPCDTEQRRAVIKHTIAALAYGIKHGFIANPFASPPLSRDGEDSAEVKRLRGLLDVALDALDSYADPTGYTDNNGEQLAPDEVVHQGLLAKETAANLRAALAATRSGSATTASGDQP